MKKLYIGILLPFSDGLDDFLLLLWCSLIIASYKGIIESLPECVGRLESEEKGYAICLRYHYPRMG